MNDGSSNGGRGEGRSFVSMLDEGIDWLGKRLVARPSLAVIGTLAFLVLEFALAGLDVPSKLYLALQTPKVSPDHINVIAVTIDTGFGILMPMATVLLVSILVLRGTLAEQKMRSRNQDARDENFKVSLREFLERNVSETETQIKSTVKEGMKVVRLHVEDRARHLTKHMDGLISAWGLVVQDDSMRDEIERLTDGLSNSHFAKDPAQRIVVRGLLKGMVTRLITLLRSIGDKGAFMDPTERRELTHQLVEATKSYHILFWGMRSPVEGTWRWHADYLDFLKAAAASHPGNVSWTFLDWDVVTEAERTRSVEHVRTLGIPCYVFDRSGRGDEAAGKFDEFFALGPFIEVFGSAFIQMSTTTPRDDCRLTWKATALRKRISSTRHEAISPQSIEETAGAEGVWAADEIDKLVRVGIVNEASSREFTVLGQILKRRRPVGV